MTGLTDGFVCTPLRIERRAIRRAVKGVAVRRAGMGRRAVLPGTGGPVVVAGVAGGLAAQVRPGDVVVADELRRVHESISIPSAPLLAAALRRTGLTVHCGPIVSSDRIVDGAARARLAAGRALAVDLESAALAATTTAPVAVIRSIVDTARARLWAPGTVWRGVRALHSLRTAAPALRWWLAATGPRQITLAVHPPRGQFGVGDTVEAMRAVSGGADLVLVVGSAASCHSVLLVELARRHDIPVHLIGGAADIDLRWLAGARRVGLAADAYAPRDRVDSVIHALSGLGPVTIREQPVPREAS